MKPSWKRWSLASAVAMALLGLAHPAKADSLQVQGSASGNFFNGSSNKGTDENGLYYTNANFNQVINNTGTINLGQFSVNSAFANYDPLTFKLTVDFLLPTGLTPDPLQATADVTGGVFFGFGGATIDFSNSPINFTFSNAAGSGSFKLTIADVEVSNGSSQQLTGTISNVAFSGTPEPGSVMLLMSVVGVLGLTFRKRLSSAL